MSHADKRSPSTDALETLGMIHFKDEARDAIHLAVEPVTAGMALRPGERIGIVNGIAWRAGSLIDGTRLARNVGEATHQVPYHGIVDPFLPRDVKMTERFWFVMAPRMVQSLRHVWEHPAFPEGK